MQLEKIAAQKAKTHTVYKSADGTRLPGVTTVLGVLNKPALVPWSNKLGLQGIEVGKYVDALAQVGTVAHELVLCHHKGVKFDASPYAPDIVDKAENCLLSYLEWERGHEVEPVHCEVGFTSPTRHYGGTVDLVAKIDGVLTLADYKSSKALYDEHIYQTAAYYQLLIENGVPVEAVRILRIGREETEGFEDKPVTQRQLALGAEIFNHCLAIYRKKSEFSKAA